MNNNKLLLCLLCFLWLLMLSACSDEQSNQPAQLPITFTPVVMKRQITPTTSPKNTVTPMLKSTVTVSITPSFTPKNTTPFFAITTDSESIIMGQVRYSPDGKYLVGASSKGLYFYDTQNYLLEKIIDTKATILDIAISPDSRVIAASAFDIVYLFDIDTEKILLTFESSTVARLGNLHKLAFSPDGKILATGSSNHSTSIVKLWDVNTGILSQNIEIDCYIGAITFSPDGKYLATTGSEGHCSTSIWTSDGKLLDYHGPYVSGGATDALAFSPDGRFLAEGSDTCRLWRVTENGKLEMVGEMYVENYPIFGSMAFSPDGQFLVAGTTNGLYLWQMNTGGLVHKVDAYNTRFGGIAWSLDGNILATGTDKKGIELWDIKNGILMQTLDIGLSNIIP